MRFTTVTALSLATLAAASPLPQASSTLPAWVCQYFDCSSLTGSSSSGSTTVSSESWSSGSSYSSKSAVTTPAATPKSTPTKSSNSTAAKSTSAAAATSTNTTSTASTSSSSSSDGNEWVTLHNNYRAKHVDTGALVWDETLAAGALEHSSACVFEHSSGAGEYGENLAMGTALTAQETVDMWYDEVDGYSAYWGKEDVPMSVMHFTQVVWKGTTKVGCGMYDCPDGKLATCRYQEAGNMMGSFAANVGELA